MNREILRKLLCVVIIVSAAFAVLYPLLRDGFVVTDDGGWMVIRLSAFYQNLREGQFPVRFLSRLNFGYGYPVSNFLYPGFLYIGSILHVLGLSFQNSVEGILIGSVVTGALVLFLWLRHFFGNRASTLGALSFLFMPYLLYDIYKRGSVGEVLATGVCMVAIYAIEKKSHWLLPPAVALLAVSHNTLALFFVPVLIGYIFIKQYWKLLLPFCIGIGMASFFWIPVFFEKTYVLFNLVNVSDPSIYFSASRDIILAGVPFLLAGLVSGILNRNSYRKERIFFVTVIIFSAFFALQISSFVWNYPFFVQYIQFPYRFLALWCFAGPWCIASIADSKKSNMRLLLAVVLVGTLGFVSLSYQKSQSIVRPEGFYTTNEGTTTVGNEYMPKWVRVIPVKRAEKRLEVFTGNATIEERTMHAEKIDITVHAKEDSVIQINTIYYPGWGALVDNKQTVISYDNPAGLMRISVPAGDHNVYMRFRETVERFVADVISLIFIISYMIYAVTVCVVKRKHI